MIANFQLHIWCFKFIRPFAMNKLSLLPVSKSNCRFKKSNLGPFLIFVFHFGFTGKTHEPFFS